MSKSYVAVVRRDPQTELYHYGVKGMKWGVRRYQNSDGSLTNAGKKRLAKDLKKDYMQNKSSSQPFKVSDDYKKKLDAEVKKVITDDDRQRIKSAKDRWYDSLSECDKADKALAKLAKKHAKEYYDDEMAKNGHLYDTPRAKEKLREHSIFDYGYDKAHAERPDLVKVYEKQNKLWDDYTEECRKVSDKLLGKYGDTKLYNDRYGNNLTIRKTVGDAVVRMDYEYLR